MQGWGTWRTREVLGASGDRLWGQTSRVVPAQGSAAMAGLCWQGTPGGATAGSGNAWTQVWPHTLPVLHSSLGLSPSDPSPTALPGQDRAGTCTAREFTCDDESCISSELACDFAKTCTDGSDEKLCGESVGGSWAPSSPCPESLRGWGKGTRGTPSSVWGSPGSSMVPQRRSLGFAGATTFEEGDGGWHDVSVGRLRWAVQRATEPRAIALVGAGEAISTA